jgi:DNA-binding SARP family transcriptional activator
VNANRQVSIEQLVCELWTDPPRSAVANLRTYMADLRRLVIGHDRLVTQQHGYELRLAPDEFDLRRYEALVAAGQVALDHEDLTAAVGMFTTADRLWRGPAFDGLRQAPTGLG